MRDRRKSVRRWSTLAFAMMAMVLIVAMAVPAYAIVTTTWYVATSGNDTAAGNQPWAPLLTIGKALEKAGVGDTIKVGGGTYAEHLTISTANLTLEPWDDAALVTIDGSGTGVVVTITGAGVTFKNFTVTNSQGGVKVCAGAGAPTLTGNTFTLNNPQVIDEDGLLNIAGILTANTFDGAVVVSSIPQTIWGTIQAAIGAAGGGDTIQVAAGTYTEVGQIVISKNLTIVGADKATTIIKPSADTGNSGDAKGWWLVNQGIAFNLSDVTLDGSGKKVFHGIRHKGTGTIESVHFTGITYNASTDYAGFAVYAFGMCGAVDVSDCEFDNIGREGIAYWGAGTTGTYAGNTYTGKGLGDWLDYGVEVNAGAVVTIANSTFTNNRGTATIDGSDSAGVAVLTVSGPGTAVTITGSTFTGNSLGIGIGANSADTSVVHAHGNTISGNYMSGAENNGLTAVFDATDNWWGSVNGPTHAGNKFNVGSQGDKVSDNVTYVRWLNAAAGSPFAPVTKNSDPTYYASIQAAIDAASAGAVITCAAGTFTENVTVDESVILQGAGSAATTVTAANQTDSVFTVTASNVDLSGFTATGTQFAGNNGYAGIKLANGVTGSNIHNNVVSGNQYGILLLEPLSNTATGNNTVANNTASNCGVSGIEMQNTWGNTFTDNTANGNGSNGFRLANSKSNTFTGNTANSTLGTTGGNGACGFFLVVAGGTGSNNNTFTDNTANSNPNHGFRMDGSSGNTLTGNTFSSNGADGIKMKAGSNNNTLTENTCSLNAIGIEIATADIDATSQTVQDNCITGNTTFGVSNLGAGTLDASHNWWGSVSGPGVEGPGSGDKVSANVNYVPWLDACHGNPVYPLDVSVDQWFTGTPNLVVGGDFAQFKIKVTNPAGSGVTYSQLQLRLMITSPTALTVDMFRLQYSGTWHDVTLTQSGSAIVGTYNLPAPPVGPDSAPVTTFRIKAQLSAPVNDAYTLKVELRDLAPDPDATMDSLTQGFTVGGGDAAGSQEFQTGWNMVSVPVVGADTVPETVFGDVIGSGQPLVIYEWVAAGSYHIPTAIDAGRGYWLYLFQDVTVHASGPMPTGQYTVALGADGWHQVSTPKWPVAWSAVQFTDGTDTYSFAEAAAHEWVYLVAYSYNPATKLYETADLTDGAMDPWTGYWICTRVPSLTMNIPMDQPYIPVGPSSVHSMSVPAGPRPPAPPMVPLSADLLGIEFGNSPNPIRDVHTTTFYVQGRGADLVNAIRVQIFDQGGQLVYEATEEGARLDWHTDNDYGEYLANGVYLYKLYVRVNDAWIVSDVRKLAILR